MVRFPRIARAMGTLRRHPKARLIAEYGRTYAGAYLLQRGLFLPDELPSLLGEELAREGLERLQPLPLIERTLAPDPETPFGRVAAMEASLYMRNQLLRDADWASMAHSVEVRTPLVDASLLRQLAHMLPAQRDKSALAANLPDYLRHRPKSGFFVPMKEWLDLPEDGTSTRMRSWARRVWDSLSLSRA
jgi:asparagine synthase (glutamine-hydrolysing)